LKRQNYLLLLLKPQAILIMLRWTKTVFQNGVNKVQFLYKEIPFHNWLWNGIFYWYLIIFKKG
jgi:hypothetical protein